MAAVWKRDFAKHFKYLSFKNKKSDSLTSSSLGRKNFRKHSVKCVKFSTVPNKSIGLTRLVSKLCGARSALMQASKSRKNTAKLHQLAARPPRFSSCYGYLISTFAAGARPFEIGGVIAHDNVTQDLQKANDTLRFPAHFGLRAGHKRVGTAISVLFMQQIWAAASQRQAARNTGLAAKQLASAHPRGIACVSSVGRESIRHSRLFGWSKLALPNEVSQANSGQPYRFDQAIRLRNGRAIHGSRGTES